eukprot:3458586-Amphidinium_carterae.2
MSNDSWKPRLASYGRGSSSSSGSRNTYTPWSSAGWHGGGKGSGSSGSNMPWQPYDLNAMWHGSSSSGYYMPSETVGWNAGMYAQTPMASTMSWGTAGWYTGEHVAWRPEGGTSGSRVGVPPNREQETNPKKINKKVSISVEKELISGSSETSYEEPREETTAQETVVIRESNAFFSPDQTYCPDPREMRSKPYPITAGRPYPHLVEGKVIYQSEKGKGTYPFSCVPRFSDVIEYEGFPVTPTPPSVDPKDKPVHKPEVWRKAHASKLIRQHEERRAFFHRTKLPNKEAYPWEEQYANMKDLDNKRPFDLKQRCSRVKWTVGADNALRDYCYEEVKEPPEGLHYWCYACGKAPSRDLLLARCALCGDVFMCMEHRIFPDCMHTFYNKQITICCRHSRYTPRTGSWNPVGGYPQLADVWDVRLGEEWREEGWVPNTRELQLQGLLDLPLTEEQLPMVQSLLDEPLTEEQANLVIALVQRAHATEEEEEEEEEEPASP